MRAPWTTVIRVCREVAYGIDAMSALTHGKQPSVPPYLPPSVFSAPVERSRGTPRPPTVNGR